MRIPPSLNTVAPYFFSDAAARLVRFLAEDLDGIEVQRHLDGERTSAPPHFDGPYEPRASRASPVLGKQIDQPPYDPMNNATTSSIRTCLWFRDGRGREAAEYYCSLIPGSRVEKTFCGDAGYGAFSVIDFSLGGVPYQILDAGPMFTLSEAVSISVATDDQAETDRLWAALTANGGEESHCGWLKDRYGVSWQVYPKRLTELTTSADKDVSAKAMAAMMKQMKIDIAAIEAAVRG